MAVVTCPNTECGIEVDEQVDFCPACALIAPGGAIAQVLRNDAPRLSCCSCGQTILPPYGKLFTEVKGALAAGTLNDGERCPACQRPNPTTLRWGDRPTFAGNMGLLVFKKGYWFWPLVWLVTMYELIKLCDKQNATTTKGNFILQLLGWLSIFCVLFTLSALPSVTQKVKQRPFVQKSVIYFFSHAVSLLCGIPLLALAFFLVFLIHPALLGVLFGIVFGLLAVAFCCVLVFGHILIEEHWPHYHLKILKLRGGFWVGFFYRYFRLQQFILDGLPFRSA